MLFSDLKASVLVKEYPPGTLHVRGNKPGIMFVCVCVCVIKFLSSSWSPLERSRTGQNAESWCVFYNATLTGKAQGNAKGEEKYCQRTRKSAAREFHLVIPGKPCSQEIATIWLPKQVLHSENSSQCQCG